MMTAMQVSLGRSSGAALSSSRCASRTRAHIVFLVAACLLALACNRAIPLARSVDTVTRDLSRQLAKSDTKRRLMVDPMLDRGTGQQTKGAQAVEQLLLARLATRLQNVEIVPFDAETAKNAELLLTGTIVALPKRGNYRMSVALTDTKTGLVVAQAAGNFRDEKLDPSPTEFYRDSPSLVRDRSIDGYVRTAETDRGEAADALYVEQIPTSALLADALKAYNEGKAEEALKLYSEAAERKDGQQLRTFNGLYLCNVQLGRQRAASEAFDKIVALGLSTGNLSVKLLFRPGSTEFWPDRKISGAYPMWLAQIGRALRSSESCLHIVGHTSRSGTEELNDRLSLDRATVIRSRLTGEARGLDRRLRVSGLGFRENIVGSGADDASDAVDRRVEFRVEDCKGGADQAAAGAGPAGAAGDSKTAAPAAAASAAGCRLQAVAWEQLKSLPGHGPLVKSEIGSDTQESIEEVRYADLDADGAEEAYVFVHASYGANGGQRSLYIYQQGTGCELRLLDKLEGLSGGLLSATVSLVNGRVVVDTPVLQDGDARCCPSGSERQEWRLQSGKLQRVVAAGRL